MNNDEIIKKIENILNNINTEILDYQGNNLIKDHIINSFEAIEIIVKIEEEFQLDIHPEKISWDRFTSVQNITKFVLEAVQGR